MFDNSPPAFLEKIAIVLMEDGMVEQGTHDTLLERYILIDLDKKRIEYGYKIAIIIYLTLKYTEYKLNLI
jgi:hypothetical protein